MKGKHQKTVKNRKIGELEATNTALRNKLIEKTKELNMLQNEIPAYRSIKEKLKKLERQIEENTSDKLNALEKRRKLEKDQYDNALVSIVDLINKRCENDGALTVEEWDTLYTVLGQKNTSKLAGATYNRAGRRRVGKKGQVKAIMETTVQSARHDSGNFTDNTRRS